MNIEQRKPLLEVSDLKVHFNIRIFNDNSFWPSPATVKAVDGVNFTLYEGETLGIVGESGCGKSTIARSIIGLENISSGKAVWLGQDLGSLSNTERQPLRKTMQMIFQNPVGSLNPRMTIGEIIAEPLKVYSPHLSKSELRSEVEVMMENVGLLKNMINRYPHEFSGGQCQRIGIARALILKPSMIICDEPVSALDVSIQAQIVNLLKEIQEKMGLALIFISHDLSVVKHIADRIMVMYLGKIAEVTTSDKLYSNPMHPYTKALLSAIPLPDPDLEENKKIQILEGDLPSPITPPSGCVFHTRCPEVSDKCKTIKPTLQGYETDHEVSCLLYEG